MEEFDYLKIEFKDIASATGNFGNDKLIGRGGFGAVYKGELSLPKGRIMAAFKRLDRQFGQGNTEFWKEIIMLSKYRHENLISLMHFCNEGDEMILVYEYASRGSLDRYLSDSSLTWTQRLKICIEVARALDCLHDPVGTQQRVLHRDIKSSNILLDDNWTAKVSDFGLSKIGPANQPRTYLVSNVVGTPGYCDPMYWKMGILTKESDVYSFGVVLFEVMCGRLCFEYRNRELNIKVHGWQKCYDEDRLDEIIFHHLKEQMEPGSLLTFSSIAYQCLKMERKERPTMAKIAKELEFALEQQTTGYNEDCDEGMKLIASLAVPPLVYKSRSQILKLLVKGIFVADGKTWLSVNKNLEVYKMTSAIKCISNGYFIRETVEDSRFLEVCKGFTVEDFKVDVNSQFLLPDITYIINFIYKLDLKGYGTRLPFRYKVGDAPYLDLGVAHPRDDGWLAIELHQFTCPQKELQFSIQFWKIPYTNSYSHYLFEGIEFRPVENVNYTK